ncbi:MAG: DUF4861 family protein [Rikenellaceae bacterium]
MKRCLILTLLSLISIDGFCRSIKDKHCDTLVCGYMYPNRLDDIAWESDKIGFRVYGKPNLEEGNRLYGYDIFTKRGRNPVLKELYRVQLSPENQAKLAELKKQDTEAAQLFADSISFHIDHGKGMDYYPVGPTLGCGTAALVVNEKTIYPTYYSKYEILENGPKRFKLLLEFDPVIIDSERVVEQRVITLDAGSHFNKIEVQYKGVTKPHKVIVGIVLHDKAEKYQITKNTIAYAEPMHQKGWQTYNAVIFDKKMRGVLDLFDEEERSMHGGAYGHIQAEGVYLPNTTLTYYMGAGWNGWGFNTADEWFDYVKKQITN